MTGEADPVRRAYGRILQRVQGRLVEPLSAFARDWAGEAIVRMSTEPYDPAQLPVAKGAENVLFCSHGAKGRFSLHVTGSRNAVFIGPFCDVSGAAIHVLGDDCVVFVGALTQIRTGAGIRAQGQGFSVTIGERCHLGARCVVATTDGHGIYLAKDGARINPERDVAIGDHAFIGYDARIQKGCVIEPDAIVLERSIASGLLRSGCVYQGIPATLREEDVSWSSQAEARSLAEAQDGDARLFAECRDILRRRGAAVPAP